MEPLKKRPDATFCALPRPALKLRGAPMLWRGCRPAAARVQLKTAGRLSPIVDMAQPQIGGLEMGEPNDGIALYRCAARGCGFATTEPYNFCPQCGTTLYLHDGTRSVGPSVTVNFARSKCDFAWQCGLTENYHPECEELGVTHRCVVAILESIEGLEAELRRLHSAFQEAGLQAPPRQDRVLRDRPVSVRKRRSPEPSPPGE